MPLFLDEIDQSVMDTAPDDTKRRRITPEATPITMQQPVETSAGCSVELRLSFTLGSGIQLTEGAPSEWQILLDDGGWRIVSLI